MQEPIERNTRTPGNLAQHSSILSQHQIKRTVYYKNDGPMWFLSMWMIAGGWGMSHWCKEFRVHGPYKTLSIFFPTSLGVGISGEDFEDFLRSRWNIISRINCIEYKSWNSAQNKKILLSLLKYSNSYSLLLMIEIHKFSFIIITMKILKTSFTIIIIEILIFSSENPQFCISCTNSEFSMNILNTFCVVNWIRFSRFWGF